MALTRDPSTFSSRRATRPVGFWRRLLEAAAPACAAVMACTLACLWLAVVDLVAFHRMPHRHAGQIWRVLVSLSLLGGAVIGASVSAFGAVLRRVAGRRHFLWGLSVVAAMAASPFGWVLAKGTFSGAWIASKCPLSVSVPLGTVVFASGVGGAMGVGAWLYRRALEGRFDVGSWALAVLGLGGFATSLHWINGHAFVRLYPEIHTAQTWIALAAAMFFFGLLMAWALRSLRRRRGVSAVGFGALALALGLGWWGARPMWTSHEIRFLLVDGTVLGREAVELLSAGRRSGGRWAFSRTKKAQEAPSGLVRRQGASILLITVDALRPDRMGVYSKESRLTPHLDRWARESVVFERSYCHAPHSSYSLSSLHTGEPVRSLVSLKQPLPRTLASLLQERGYNTEAFCTQGIFHTEGDKLQGYWKNTFGFRVFDPNGYDAKKLTDKALFALRELGRRKKPFFVWVHYFDVHEPYRRHEAFDFGSKPHQRYDSEVAYTEREVARLIREARRTRDNLILVLTADHGEEFGEHGGHYHGNSVYDEQVRVPLVVSVPRVASKRVSSPVSLTDVTPTLLDILGVEPPHSLKGRSLAAHLLGKEVSSRPVFGEVDTKRMVVWGRFKLIVDTWRRTVELYDLKQDPQERRNLVGRRRDEVKKLKQALNDHMAGLGGRNEGLPKALALARLGGEQAREGLCRLAKNGKADVSHRLEAIKRLAKTKGGCAPAALEVVMLSEVPSLAQEAAIALGELRRPEAGPALRLLMASVQDPDVRHRAAIAAGRLKLKSAAPFLVEALLSPNETIRYRASHYLGQVGGGEHLAALMRAADDAKAAHLVAVSLGQVGYRAGGRAAHQVLSFLQRWAAREKSDHVLSAVIKGIGYLGLSAAGSTLLTYLGRKDLAEAREAMVRTEALGGEDAHAQVWGMDFPPASSRGAGIEKGKRQCGQRKAWTAFSFLHRTTCRLSPESRFFFSFGSHRSPSTPGAGDTPQKGAKIQNLPAPKKLWLTLKPRGLGSGASPRITLSINGRRLDPKALRAGWQDLVWTLPKNVLQPGRNQVVMKTTAATEIELDHLLLF